MPIDLSTLMETFDAGGQISLKGRTEAEKAELIRTARLFFQGVKHSLIAEAGVDPDVFSQKSMPQSELFMVEIIPFIHRLFFDEPTNKEISVLDIGPQTFSGTSLLSRLHSQTSFNNLKMRISAVDIHDKFSPLKDLICPEVEFIKTDIAAIRNRKWDCVICSHVIEHVDDPRTFVNNVKKITNKVAIFACPWNETPIETSGHVNIINKEFVRSIGASELSIFTNYMWGKRREVCIFVVRA